MRSYFKMENNEQLDRIESNTCEILDLLKEKTKPKEIKPKDYEKFL